MGLGPTGWNSVVGPGGASGTFVHCDGAAVSMPADLTEDTLMSYTLPAHLLDPSGSAPYPAVRINAFFTQPAGDGSLPDRTYRIYFGATKILEWTTEAGAVPQFNFVTGIVQTTGSNAQLSFAYKYFVSSTTPQAIAAATSWATVATPAESTGSSILIKCTGQTDDGLAGAIVQVSFIVEVLK